LAIITMQTTPVANCAQRFQEGAAAPVDSYDVTDITKDSPTLNFLFDSGRQASPVAS
jgi:hypothetical protein